MMKPSERLRRAKTVIDSPEKWTQGYYARTRDGSTCSTKDKNAVGFCSVGALWKAFPYTAANGELRFLDQAMGKDVVDFNDNQDTEHGDVMRAWDLAIKLAEQAEAEE